jgi:UDP-3-O-[3-hydroxymyristoyl] glucosamine N-acyltransferase
MFECCVSLPLIMTITAEQLALLLDGALEGDPHIAIRKFARIEEAGAGDLAFLDNPKYEPHAYTTAASILLVGADFTPAQPVSATLLRVADVRKSLVVLMEKYAAEANGQADNAGDISVMAVVHPDAIIGKGVVIHPFVVVEAHAVVADRCVLHPQVYVGRRASIGAGSVLHTGAKVHYNCQVGAHCILHSNVVVGADGFGFVKQPDGTWTKMPHTGTVVIESNVEIGASTCIDRGSIGDTIVREGVKIDNLVHIAHNVEIGRNTVIAAQTGIAGSAKIGENCMFGGQTGIAGHLKIAPGTQIQAQSGISASVEAPNQALFGSPALPYNDFVRAFIVFKQLPALQKQVRALVKKIGGE